MTQYKRGLDGEELAAEHLRKLGYTIVQTRYRARHGEIDLIALQGKYLCFIEVKYRPQGRLGDGLGSITPRKLDRMRQAIREYLAKHPRPYRLGCLEITRAGILYYDNVLKEA